MRTCFAQSSSVSVLKKENLNAKQRRNKVSTRLIVRNAWNVLKQSNVRMIDKITGIENWTFKQSQTKTLKGKYVNEWVV